MRLAQFACLSHVGCRRLSTCVVVLDSAHATSDLHASLIRLIVKPIRICGRDLSFLRHVVLVVRETTLASTCSVRHDAVAALKLSTSTFARADGASLRNLAHSTHVRHRVESILRRERNALSGDAAKSRAGHGRSKATRALCLVGEHVAEA